MPQKGFNIPFLNNNNTNIERVTEFNFLGIISENFICNWRHLQIKKYIPPKYPFNSLQHTNFTTHTLQHLNRIKHINI